MSNPSAVIPASKSFAFQSAGSACPKAVRWSASEERSYQLGAMIPKEVNTLGKKVAKQQSGNVGIELPPDPFFDRIRVENNAQ